MTQSNTPEEIEFFQALATGNVEVIHAAVSKNRQMLDCFDYRNFGATPLTAACFSNRPHVSFL